MEGHAGVGANSGIGPARRRREAVRADEEHGALAPHDKLRLLRTFHFTVTRCLADGLNPSRAAATARRPLASRIPVRTPTCGPWPCLRERLNREVALTLAYPQEPGAIGEILEACRQGQREPGAGAALPLRASNDPPWLDVPRREGPGD